MKINFLKIESIKIFFLIVCSFFFTHSAYCQEKDYSLSLQTEFYSKYLGRGELPTDGPVFQPSATLEYKGLIINMWGSMDIDNVNDNKNEFNELDLTLEYGWSYEKVDISGGIIFYSFPNTEADSTSEVYLVTELNVLLEPSASFFYDFEEAKGLYASFDLGESTQAFRVIKNVTCELVTNAGFGWGSENMNAFLFGVEESALIDFHAGIGVPFAVTESFCVELTASVSFLLDEAIKDAMKDNRNIATGLIASYTF